MQMNHVNEARDDVYIYPAFPDLVMQSYLLHNGHWILNLSALRSVQAHQNNVVMTAVDIDAHNAKVRAEVKVSHV